MKNHELLDILGEVNGDYVLAAEDNVVRPRFRWRTLAACAACAALVLGAYPVYRAVNPPLHSYTVVEGGALTTLGDEKAPAGGGNAALEDAVSGGEDAGGLPKYPEAGGDQLGSGLDGEFPVDEAAANQYDQLLRGMGMHGEGAAAYPDWFAGAWIDHGGAPGAPAVLHVAVVEKLRTPGLEAEIMGWCGDTVVVEGAKYSHNFLDSLMDPVVKALDGSGLSCGIGVDVTANCLGVDLYSDGQTIPDSILAQLARLDPAGDAIRVRLFTGKLDTLTDGAVKGAASADTMAPAPVDPEGRSTPSVTVDGDTPVYHGEDAPADAVPGGALPGGAYVSEPPRAGESSQPAGYDLLDGAEE